MAFCCASSDSISWVGSGIERAKAEMAQRGRRMKVERDKSIVGRVKLDLVQDTKDGYGISWEDLEVERGALCKKRNLKERSLI